MGRETQSLGTAGYYSYILKLIQKIGWGDLASGRDRLKNSNTGKSG